MKEFTVIVWTMLILVFGFILMFALKKKKRTMEKYAMIYKLILTLTAFLLSFVVYYFLNPSPHLVWATRFSILLLGILNVWVLYQRPWTIRHATDYKEDAFFPEFSFVAISGLLVAIAFVTAPQVTEIVPYRVNVSQSLWDAPILFLLPFLFLKMADFSGQVPFKIVEKPWVFPLEKINAELWPWRDLLQVNFQVNKSLVEEYDLFAWPARPWIEAPKEISLGHIFQLCIQERRKRKDLSTIQDLGDEYGGTPEFCWIFYSKRCWYKPTTWFRNPRYLNPDLSINQNKINKGEIIIAKRIPGDGTALATSSMEGIYQEDPYKTVIIRR